MILCHLTGMILRQGEARFEMRCGVSDEKRNVAMAQKHPDSGGSNRPFGSVVAFVRCTTPRFPPRPTERKDLTHPMKQDQPK
ncbi:MAG: hypothetical protein ACR2OX_11220, partial [Methyloligellaceae bacterium]